jgi:hypothetical protein
MNIRIGLDLDNTIIDYRRAFESYLQKNYFYKPEGDVTKEVAKRFLQAKGGDVLWQKCQFEIYSFRFQGARLAPGLLDFIRQARGFADLYIVSHKSNYAAYDSEKKHNLREAAHEWLLEKGVISLDNIPAENMYFAESIDQKISYIKQLGLTHFVDDLDEILKHSRFPGSTQGFLFSTVASSKRNRVENFYMLSRLLLRDK